MNKVFADTGYWIALLNPGDNLHDKAVEVSERLGPVMTFTSDMVLAELVNGLSRKGLEIREAATRLCHALLDDASVSVVPQTRLQFLEALKRHEERRDKAWGLTDCASMMIMEKEGIVDALTPDKHFKEAGFNALLFQQREDKP